jgi:hypothetical protein
MSNSETKDSVEAAALIRDLRPPRVELNTAKEPCMEGTRENILASINEWLNDSTSPNIGWLNGFPGAGKSAIAMSLAHTLHSSGHLGSSYFFQQEDAARQTASLLFCTIAADLAGKYPSVCKNILVKLKQNVINFNNIAGLFSHLIIEPLLAMSKRDIADYGHPTLIIDALDECGGLEGQASRDRERFMSSLQGWSLLPSQFKILITSHNEIDIQHFMQNIPHKPWTLLTGDSTTVESSDDITHFFNERFKVIAMKHFPRTSRYEQGFGYPVRFRVLYPCKYESGFVIYKVHLTHSNLSGMSTRPGYMWGYGYKNFAYFRVLMGGCFLHYWYRKISGTL